MLQSERKRKLYEKKKAERSTDISMIKCKTKQIEEEKNHHHQQQQ